MTPDPFHAAHAEIESRLDAAADAAQPRSIGITGAPGAGKTTLARALAARRPGSLVLSTDRYLPDYARLAPEQYDLPDRADLTRLAADIRDLRAGRDADTPVWSFEAHARVGSERLGPLPPGAWLIVEGIHALEPAVRPLLDLAVYVESPAEVRVRRVVSRERAGERGWTPEQAEAFLRETADPVFAARARSLRDSADLIIGSDDAPGG